MGRIGANISGIELKLLNRWAQANAAVTLNSLRLASGAKIASPRDNPSGFVNLSGLQGDLSTVKATLANVTAASGLVAQTQLVLDQIRTQLNTVRTKALADQDQALTADERAANQAAIDAAIAKLDTLAASDVGGRRMLDGSANFTFAGINTSQVANVDVISLGDAASQTISGAVTVAATQAQLVHTEAGGSISNNATFSLTGDRGSASIDVTSGESLSTVATRINQESHLTGVLASVAGNDLQLTSIEYGTAAQVGVEVTSGTFAVTGGSAGTDYGADGTATIDGQSVTGDGNRFSLNSNRFQFSIEFQPNFTGAFSTITATGKALTFALTTDLNRTSTLALPSVYAANLGGLSGNLAQLATGGAVAGLGANAPQAVRIVDEALASVTRLDGRVDGFANEVVAASSNSLSGIQTVLENSIDAVNRVDDNEELLLLTKNQALASNALAALSVLDAQRASMIAMIRKIAGRN